MWKIHVSKGSLGHIQLHLPSTQQYTPAAKSSILYSSLDEWVRRAKLFAGRLTRWLIWTAHLFEHRSCAGTQGIRKILDGGKALGRIFRKGTLERFFHQQRNRDPFLAQSWRPFEQMFARDLFKRSHKRPGT